MKTKVTQYQLPTVKKERKGPDYIKVNNYIFGCISTIDYDTDAEKPEDLLQFLYDTFYSEKMTNRTRENQCNMFADWCAGLPTCFDVEYRNHRIIELAVLWDSIPQDNTESQREKILNNWFNFIAVNTFKLFRKYKIVMK